MSHINNCRLWLNNSQDALRDCYSAHKMGVISILYPVISKMPLTTIQRIASSIIQNQHLGHMTIFLLPDAVDKKNLQRSHHIQAPVKDSGAGGGKGSKKYVFKNARNDRFQRLVRGKENPCHAPLSLDISLHQPFKKQKQKQENTDQLTSARARMLQDESAIPKIGFIRVVREMFQKNVQFFYRRERDEDGGQSSMQMTSEGLLDLRSGGDTSLRTSLDFLSMWLLGAGGPLEDTVES